MKVKKLKTIHKYNNLNITEKNTMTNIFGFTTILAAILAAGSIEDCGGACIGNENWTAFFICLTIMTISGILTLLTMKKG